MRGQNQAMNNLLLNAVDRYAAAHAEAGGMALTPFDGLSTMRLTAPNELQHSIQKPLVCLVLQGAKQVTIGKEPLELRPGNSMLISADLPAVSQIVRQANRSLTWPLRWNWT